MTGPTPLDEDDLGAHGREGSNACCGILLLLHRHPNDGLAAGDLQVMLGLSRADLEQALRGLRHRHRIAPNGRRGIGARWLLAQHARQVSA